MGITANWIWRKQVTSKYNDFIVAKKEFCVSGDIREAIISVTADSFYRLFINGEWLCDGPARGWPEHYYYDQADITSHLQDGLNEVKLIACYYGTGHFHGMPQQGGMLAQIDINYADDSTERVITDKDWQVARALGWHSNTPKISCQMSPGEYYDARNQDNLYYEDAAVIYETHEGPWKDIRPRDVKMLTKKPVKFRRFVGANTLRHYDDNHTYCLPWAKLLYPGLIQANRRLMPAFALATVIKADADMQFTVNLTDYRNGGYTICIDGHEIEAPIQLSAGRHLLFISNRLSLNHTTDITFSVSADGPFKIGNPYKPESDNPWAMLVLEEFKCAENDMAWQRETVEFQTCREGYLRETKALSGLSDIGGFVSGTSDKVMDLTAEVMFAKDSYRRFLTRQEVDDESVKADCPENILSGHEGVVSVLPSGEGDVELVYDLGEQNVGYYSFELEAQEGVEVDLYAVEYITPDGKIQFPDDHRNGMTYITKAGVNTFTSLKRRAGRYIFIRLTNQTEPVRIHRFNLIESTYPADYKGSFQCSDESLNKIWDISAHTLKLCMEDTFTDCPLYEQTLWVGDARNESLFAYGIFGATDIAKRCIVLAAQSLERFPMVGCQLPSSWHCILPAWSFLWGISVWDYYWYTKDEHFLAEMWPYVIRNLKGAAGYINQDGLFSSDFWNLFDWAGIDQDHETVFHNSLFMVGAIDAAVQCGQVLGKEAELNWLEELRAKLKTSINHFRQDSKKAYPDSIHEDGTISDSVSQHTSFLSLLYDIAEPGTTESLMNHIIEPSEQTVKVGSPFAILYMYEMLDKFGRCDLIMKSIYESYLPMLKAGATTVWESFASGTLGYNEFPTRSHCHAWSSAPVYFLNRIILGIRQTSPGCESFEISPYITDMNWAKGSFATPKGNLEVSWRKDGDKLRISYAAPAGIEVIFKENDTLCAKSVEIEKK